MRPRIADLWLLTRDGLIPDIRGPLFSSRQIEREIRRANDERRQGDTSWTAVELEETIREYVRRRITIPPFISAGARD
jgi:hypothetical protein